MCAEHGPRWVFVRVGSAADVIVQRAGRVVLVRRAMEPFKGFWSSIGGFVNPGEHPAETARREALEELGVNATLIGILGAYTQPYRDHEWLTTTVYVGSTMDDPEPDPSEVEEWAWFAPQDIPQVIAWNHRERLVDWANWSGSGRELTRP
jgi:8-oxo-dGTP diphosphatase